MIQFVYEDDSVPKYVEEIDIGYNNLRGDTIFICGDYGTEAIEYNLLDSRFESYEGLINIGRGNYGWYDHFDIQFHVNDSVFSSETSLKDLNLKTGDIIKIQN